MFLMFIATCADPENLSRGDKDVSWKMYFLKYFKIASYKLHWNILASFIPLCLHAVNINSVNDERSILFY